MSGGRDILRRSRIGRVRWRGMSLVGDKEWDGSSFVVVDGIDIDFGLIRFCVFGFEVIFEFMLVFFYMVI